MTQYAKMLALCIFAFLGILLTTRLDDIARFATLGAEIRYVILFAMHQIPCILPIVIPISCLISAILLFQHLSHTHELTALRGCGLALGQIVGPVLFAGSLMALCNFYVISELATASHLATRQLHHELKSINPLILLQNPQFLRLKGMYANVLGPTVAGESMSDVIVATKNAHERRLQLMLGKQLRSTSHDLMGSGLSVIASVDPRDTSSYDHLILENVENVTMPIQDISGILRREGWRLSLDHLTLPLLMVRTRGAFGLIQQAKEESRPLGELANYQKEFNRCRGEIARRLSVSLAAFAFTLMGAAFGMGVGRNASRRGTVWVIGLAILYLACFFGAKSLDSSFLASSLLYSLPLAFILIMSLWQLRRASRGVE